ncbi:DMT family transporter [Streptomyces sp. NPDC059637]|uniref:EamA family transporter n=1 Tax=Streptomyces sp. NPDC059637 TaxID=3347752 RepID=UPI0036C3EF5D
MARPATASAASAAGAPAADDGRGRQGGAALLVLGGALSTQFGAAVAALLFPAAGPLGVVVLRLAVAAVVLMVLVRPRLRGRSRADWGVVAAYGLVLAGMNAAIYQAIERVPLGVAVTLEFLGPLALAVVMSRRPLDAVWVVLAGAGVLLLARAESGGGHGGAGGGLDPVGVAFALAAAVCWAGYILLAARAGARFPGTDGLALAMTVGALAVLPLGVADAGAALVEPRVLVLGAAVALLSSVLPYTLELFSLRILSTGTFGILMSLGPALAALAGWLVLGQALAWQQTAAIVMVVLAGAGSVRFSRPPA